MLTIHLHNLLFHSYHGIFEEEKILGNNFELNVDVELNAVDTITRLQQTVDYAALYTIIKNCMELPTPLLETVAQQIAEKFRLFDDKIKSVAISIKKTYPPISNFQGSLGITYSKVF